MKIVPVLLAGGAGTRLWPLSRKSFPKQFSALTGNKTLFQQSAIRLSSSDQLEFCSHITLTNSDFRFIVSEQLQEVGVDPKHILIEPESKNTAAAILAASIFAHSKDKNAILLVAPSDHVMPDTQDFHRAVLVGLSHVQNGKIVTFGIKPTRAETGYGYLELSTYDLDKFETSDVVNFIEKPDLRDAEEMLKKDNFLWNAGIFLFKASDMIEAFRSYASDTLEFVTNAVELATTDLGFLRISPEHWSQVENISIDCAIMEKAENLVAVRYSSKWSDLGGWDAVWSETSHDEFGNAISLGAHSIDCKGTLLRSEHNEQQIVGLGLENIMAIAMPDAVLVAHKDRAQDVKKVVALLQLKEISQAEIFPKDFRPWGWFESIALGNRFQVKRICVKSGAALSLQSHSHRSEHWVVVEGTAKVTIGDRVELMTEGQSVYVPLGAVHRLENPGKLPIVLIEVQIGKYLGEDDIVRYEDIYSRA